jgi:hypothetical protein
VIKYLLTTSLNIFKTKDFIVITKGEKMAIKEALIKKLEGDVALSEANLKTFLENPIGVAEHIDYVETAEKELIKLTDAKDKLATLKDL